MNKTALFLLMIFILGGVSAMDDSIVVKTEPGYKVKLYVWPAEAGKLINMMEGFADDNGFFETTFFSLAVPNVKYQVMVIDEKDKKIYDTKFTGFGIDKPLYIDCTGSDCVMSVASENEEPAPTVKEVVVSDEENQTESNQTFTGYAFWKIGEDKSFLPYIIGTIVLILLFIIWRKFDTLKRKAEDVTGYFSKDAELARLEREIRKEDQIINRIIRQREQRKKDVEIAKKRLELENKRLEEMVIRRKLKY